MVRVLIERHIAEGMVEDFHQALTTIREQATGREGYISGESLCDKSDPHHYFVISTWQSAEDWQAWEASEGRRALMAAIAPLFEEAENITILEPV